MTATGNPFIDLPKPEGFAKIRHPRETRIFIERQMQSEPKHHWAFVCHTGIDYYLPEKFATQADAIAAVDVALVPNFANETHRWNTRVHHGQAVESDIRAYVAKRWPDVAESTRDKVVALLGT